MSGFRLLAIRPLKDCSPKFLKALEEETIYKFYNEYSYYESEEDESEVEAGKSVNFIKQRASISEGLYNTDKVKLNISAIVGKNGSGKSSLTELLFVSIYLLSVELQILKKNDWKDDKGKDAFDRMIEKKERERLILRNQISQVKRLLLRGRDKKMRRFRNRTFKQSNQLGLIEKLNGLRKRNGELNSSLKYLKRLKGELLKLKETVKVELFYQIDGSVYRLQIKYDDDRNLIDNKIVGFNSNSDDDQTRKGREEVKVKFNRDTTIDRVLDKPFKKMSESFFYSLVLNYSQYALNAKHIGPWVNELFHKNDAYQTPIVINPMRDDGNYDINRENDLARQRLLANVLGKTARGEEKDSLRNLAQDRVAYWLKIELIKERFQNETELIELKYLKKFSKEWNQLEEYFLSNIESERRKTEWDEYARDYLLGKLISMSEKYEPYKPYFDNNQFLDLEKYFKDLEEDDSHIAFKFHQAVNFLKYEYANFYVGGDKWKDIHIIADEVARVGVENEMHLIPPSFLKIDVCFNEEKPSDEESNTLQSLSSGEKQYIYSISSVMYHLRYIDSVDINKKGIEYKYQNVNLIFDEIELYYHPDLQRRFISDFRQAVVRCRLNGIKNINCLFITHSPFILSDIPASNVLKLNRINGKSVIQPNDQKTFGANVHDLLADGFFMEDGFMGEFAKKEISWVIDSMRYYELIKRVRNKKLDQDILDKAKKELKKIEHINDENAYDQEKCEKLIAIVGEPLLYTSLMELYSEVFSESKDQFIEEQIEKLRRLQSKNKKKK